MRASRNSNTRWLRPSRNTGHLPARRHTGHLHAETPTYGHLPPANMEHLPARLDRAGSTRRIAANVA